MGRNQAGDDTVTVHVTPRGGLYVNERELLRSKAAQETMDRMDRVMAELMEDSAGAIGVSPAPPIWVPTRA